MSIRLLLVDDHALFLDGLRAVFSYEGEFEVAGVAYSADAAVEQVRKLHPDVVLMDVDMPAEDGVEATRRIKAEAPDTAVVMLTVHDDTERLLAAMKAGAQGYLLKNIRSAELLEQLRGLSQGEAAISRRMAIRILQEFQRRSDPQEPDTDLTNRELEILELVAGRLSNKEIAAKLVISEHTVKNHLKNILSKLHVRSRREAAAYGVARGWVRPQRLPAAHFERTASALQAA